RILRHDIARIVDEVAIIAGATDHLVSAGAAVEIVLSDVAIQGVVAAESLQQAPSGGRIQGVAPPGAVSCEQSDDIMAESERCVDELELCDLLRMERIEEVADGDLIARIGAADQEVARVGAAYFEGDLATIDRGSERNRIPREGVERGL